MDADAIPNFDNYPQLDADSAANPTDTAPPTPTSTFTAALNEYGITCWSSTARHKREVNISFIHNNQVVTVERILRWIMRK
ncbi:MAG: hypothetical protein U0694_28775 [Anaerolineae bacterium]